MDLKFETPPSPKRPNARHPHVTIAKLLKDRPGEWALTFTNEGSATAHKIRNGLLPAYRPAGSFEATSRELDQKTGRAERIYVRYVGENGEHA